MSLSALDIVALARAGFSAEQIGAINAESTQSPASTVSTESTESTESTLSTEFTNLSTVQEPEKPVQEINPTPAPEPVKQAAAAQDQGPTMQDLMSKLAAMENRLQTNAILNDQQPGQQSTLTGQDVLARILDPTIE
jgi:hypothetical protein